MPKLSHSSACMRQRHTLLRGACSSQGHPLLAAAGTLLTQFEAWGDASHVRAVRLHGLSAGVVVLAGACIHAHVGVCGDAHETEGVRESQTRNHHGPSEPQRASRSCPGRAPAYKYNFDVVHCFKFPR